MNPTPKSIQTHQPQLFPPIPSKPQDVIPQQQQQQQQPMRPITPAAVVIPQQQQQPYSSTPMTDYSRNIPLNHWNGSSGDHLHASTSTSNTIHVLSNENYGNNWQQPVVMYQQQPKDLIYGGELNHGSNNYVYITRDHSVSPNCNVTTNVLSQNSGHVNGLNNSQQLHVPMDQQIQNVSSKRNSSQHVESNKTSLTNSSSPSASTTYNNHQETTNNSHFSSKQQTPPAFHQSSPSSNHLTTGLNSTINHHFHDVSQFQNNFSNSQKIPKKSVSTDNPINKIANVVEDFIDRIVPGDKGTRVDLTEPKPIKGLSNNIGEYNCFLNVVIQSLWNSRPFRELFLSIDKDRHFHKDPQSCVFCALKTLFTTYETDARSVIEPNDVRTSLSFAHNKDSKFQLRRMDDASEAFVSLKSFSKYS